MNVPEQVCMERSSDCWGEVAPYLFDMDLPVLTLCQGHLKSMFASALPHVIDHLRALHREGLL